MEYAITIRNPYKNRMIFVTKKSRPGVIVISNQTTGNNETAVVRSRWWFLVCRASYFCSWVCIISFGRSNNSKGSILWAQRWWGKAQTSLCTQTRPQPETRTCAPQTRARPKARSTLDNDNKHTMYLSTKRRHLSIYWVSTTFLFFNYLF